MDLNDIANLAKKELDKQGGIDGLAKEAKAEFEKRGGVEGLKETVEHVAGAAHGHGSTMGDAKAAVEALVDEAKHPGKA